MGLEQHTIDILNLKINAMSKREITTDNIVRYVRDIISYFANPDIDIKLLSKKRSRQLAKLSKQAYSIKEAHIAADNDFYTKNNFRHYCEIFKSNLCKIKRMLESDGNSERLDDLELTHEDKLNIKAMQEAKCAEKASAKKDNTAEKLNSLISDAKRLGLTPNLTSNPEQNIIILQEAIEEELRAHDIIEAERFNAWLDMQRRINERNKKKLKMLEQERRKKKQQMLLEEAERKREEKQRLKAEAAAVEEQRRVERNINSAYNEMCNICSIMLKNKLFNPVGLDIDKPRYDWPIQNEKTDAIVTRYNIIQAFIEETGLNGIYEKYYGTYELSWDRIYWIWDPIRDMLNWLLMFKKEFRCNSHFPEERDIKIKESGCTLDAETILGIFTGKWANKDIQDIKNYAELTYGKKSSTFFTVIRGGEEGVHTALRLHLEMQSKDAMDKFKQRLQEKYAHEHNMKLKQEKLKALEIEQKRAARLSEEEKYRELVRINREKEELINGWRIKTMDELRKYTAKSEAERQDIEKHINKLIENVQVDTGRNKASAEDKWGIDISTIDRIKLIRLNMLASYTDVDYAKALEIANSNAAYSRLFN